MPLDGPKLMAHLAKHVDSATVMQPAIAHAYRMLKEAGCKDIGILGFCWGGAEAIKVVLSLLTL
jgi:dienelactone hydrolase